MSMHEMMLERNGEKILRVYPYKGYRIIAIAKPGGGRTYDTVGPNGYAVSTYDPSLRVARAEVDASA